MDANAQPAPTRRILVAIVVLAWLVAASPAPARVHTFNTRAVLPDTGGAAYAPPADSVPRTAPGTGGAGLPDGRKRHKTRKRSKAGARMTHRFPVAGPYSLGDADMRFGAKREGHIHQGQDIAAAKGTPVVAPIAGSIIASGYDPAGAGYYLVLSATSEDYDYVFMHLAAGSVQVIDRQSVRTGQQIAAVGNTGHSFGAHLHFEVWRGAWFAGGAAIDPLPMLQSGRPAT